MSTGCRAVARPSEVPSESESEPVLVDPTQAERWARLHRESSAADLLVWAHETFGDRLAVATSFQAEGVVILDLLHELGLSARVLTVDTGRLPEETLELIDRVRSRYRLEVEIVYPRAEDVQELVRAGGPNLFLDGPESRIRCCSVRKVEPFRRALEGVECWVSGLRRSQGGARAQAGRVELDLNNRPAGGLLKLNPLLDWTEERVWERIRERRVPHHALYDRGYRSIGCAPCTRASRPAEEERASRWWWESGPKECGLHPRLVPLGVASERVPAGDAGGAP